MARGGAVTPATKLLVRKRANGLCERCGGSLSGDYSHHHRMPRGMGGTRNPHSADAANIVLLCGSGVTGCHGWLESNRTVALEEGWLVRQGQDPAKIPVQRLGELVRLDRDGCISSA